jgi:hypothetical protein
MPTTVLKASIIAKVQQKVLDRAKPKFVRPTPQYTTYNPPKPEAKPAAPSALLWQDRQLRDYRKANGLCYSCGDKFVPGHMAVCPKRNKPQVNALAVNDLDRELFDEVLNEMKLEDQLKEDFSQLSINALSGQDNMQCMKLKAKVKDKVMLILVDSGRTHSFISSTFVLMAKLPTVSIPPKNVKLANGQCLVTSTLVKNLECYCQGQYFTTDMVVLDMHPYDAILGYDWLQTHSPMQCDWAHKTL